MFNLELTEAHSANDLAYFVLRLRIGSVSLPAPPYFQANSIDHLMNEVHRYVRDFGEKVGASRGSNYEIRGATLLLTNPLARLSVSYSRNKPFSGLGELLWYLAKTDSADFIRYYIQAYEKEEVDGRIQDAYGPRLFQMHNKYDQVARVIDLLTLKPNTRRAVIQIFDSSDQEPDLKSAPCTCTLQFLSRGSSLDLVVSMRSNDAFKGLPHDIFCFTMIQELVACSLGVRVGCYHHFVGSLHIYDQDLDRVGLYLDEGYQETPPMDEMPTGNPWEVVTMVSRLESQIRLGASFDKEAFDRLPSYWADIVRMLRAYKAWRSGDEKQVHSIRKEMKTRFFDLFLQEKIDAGPQRSLWQ